MFLRKSVETRLSGSFWGIDSHLSEDYIMAFHVVYIQDYDPADKV